jgi:hypothetical protein
LLRNVATPAAFACRCDKRTRSAGTWDSIDRMRHPEFDPHYVFSHHTQTPEKMLHHEAIHAGAQQFAETILAHTPPSSDQTTALRLLREAAMMANAAIALDGRLK